MSNLCPHCGWVVACKECSKREEEKEGKEILPEDDLTAEKLDNLISNENKKRDIFGLEKGGY